MDFRIQIGFRISEGFFWIFRWDFRISEWTSGFQIGFLPTVYEIYFVTDPRSTRARDKLDLRALLRSMIEVGEFRRWFRTHIRPIAIFHM